MGSGPACTESFSGRLRVFECFGHPLQCYVCSAGIGFSQSPSKARSGNIQAAKPPINMHYLCEGLRLFSGLRAPAVKSLVPFPFVLLFFRYYLVLSPAITITITNSSLCMQHPRDNNPIFKNPPEKHLCLLKPFWIWGFRNKSNSSCKSMSPE